jgi:hypothetical protein
MWFAALGPPQHSPWLGPVIVRLFQNQHDVTQLFEHNPFPKAPPHYLRASFYRYRFTTAEEHRQTGAWWKRQLLGEYFHEVSIDQLR